MITCKSSLGCTVTASDTSDILVEAENSTTLSVDISTSTST